MVYINGKEHIMLCEVARRLDIGYRTAYAYMRLHTDIPRQKIGHQWFVVYDDFREHPRYVRRATVTV